MRRAISAPKLRAGNHNTVEVCIGASGYDGGSKTLGWVVCYGDELAEEINSSEDVYSVAQENCNSPMIPDFEIKTQIESLVELKKQSLNPLVYFRAIEMLKKHFPQLQVNYKSERPGDVKESQNAPGLLKSLFPTITLKTFEDALAETVDWLK
jgi:hypothetical protein